jgi:hypothetical protein
VPRYRAGGLAALADRSHRPQSCPHQIAADTEAAVRELRRSHARWVPARPAFELSRGDIMAVPSQATFYRVLVRNGLMHVGYSHTCCYTKLAVMLGDVAGEGQQ